MQDPKETHMSHGMIRFIATLFLACLSLMAQGVEVVTYYHNDALGSPIIATDQEGRVVWRKSYEPYGQPIGPTAPDEPGYTGKFEEPDLGIQYFGARWYDPRIGRFLGIDPAGFDPQNPQSFNRYAYANNNPYGFVDPDGRAPTVPYGPLFDPGMAGGSYGMGYGRISRAQTPPRATVQGTAEAGGNRSTVPRSEVAKSTSNELTTFFPTNNGFLGSPTNATLQPGQIIDRFGGSEVSRFFSPAGTPAAMRAPPPGTQSQPLRTFEVLKPIDVQSGQVASAFNQVGLGTQFRSSQQLGELLEQGFFREIKK